jgi:hypothetical protein
MRLERGAAAAVVGIALLAGCSDGATANETLPSTSTSAAPSSDAPAPLGPPDMPMPAEAREQTAAGAEAFLRYYMDIYNWSQLHMDAAYMDQLSQGCATCDSLTANLRNDAEAGYLYEGGGVTVGDTSFAEIKMSRIEGAFSMKQAALTVRAADGSTVSDLSAPPAALDCGAILSWSSDDTSWIFTQWDVN